MLNELMNKVNKSGEGSDCTGFDEEAPILDAMVAPGDWDTLEQNSTAKFHV